MVIFAGNRLIVLLHPNGIERMCFGQNQRQSAIMAQDV